MIKYLIIGFLIFIILFIYSSLKIASEYDDSQYQYKLKEKKD